MQTIDLIIFILLIVMFILFILSRKQLKETGAAAARQKRMTEMTVRTREYADEGLTKAETIEHLKADFKLGDREAVYLYDWTMEKKGGRNEGDFKK